MQRYPAQNTMSRSSIIIKRFTFTHKITKQMTLFNKIRIYEKLYETWYGFRGITTYYCGDFHGCVYIFVWPRILVVVLQACKLVAEGKKILDSAIHSIDNWIRNHTVTYYLVLHSGLYYELVLLTYEMDLMRINQHYILILIHTS